MKNKKKLAAIMDDPIDDAEMKTYIGQDAKILKYSALKNFKHVDELMPNATDFIVLLYETSPNEGHWVSVLKYPERFGRSTLEYFDPYAHALDEPLNWNTPSVNKQLGVASPYLSLLMNSSGHKLLQNNIKFQHDSPKIETCGRHTIYRILKLFHHGLKQREYNDHMRLLKTRNENKTYDEIVSSIINVT
jgi:hypothetical protein